MAVDSKAIVRRFMDEAWNKGNLAVMGELCADRYVSHEPLVGELRGIEAMKKHIAMFRSAFPDLVLTVEDIAIAGDRVYTRWVARGTHRGAFMGIPPTNRPTEIRGMSVNRIQGNKIAEHHVVFDTLALFQSMGVVPALDRLTQTTGEVRAPIPH